MFFIGCNLGVPGVESGQEEEAETGGGGGGGNSSRYFLNKLEVKSNQQRLPGIRFAPFDVICKRALYLSFDWFIVLFMSVCYGPRKCIVLAVVDTRVFFF